MKTQNSASTEMLKHKHIEKKVPPERKKVHFKPSDMKKTRKVPRTPQSYLGNDMLFISQVVRGMKKIENYDFRISKHLKFRQGERGIQTRSIYEIFNSVKAFTYQKDRMWKIEGNNGLSIVIAIDEHLETNEKIIFGITVYESECDESINYHHWKQREKELAKRNRN